jgi:hypothetical protein
MMNCIVCDKPLSDTELSLNLTFHSKCSNTVISEALKQLGWVDKEGE